MAISGQTQGATPQPHQAMLGKDVSWDSIAGEICLIESFSPFARVSKGRVLSASKHLPYGLLTVRCSTVRSGPFEWPITNRLDFAHLWEAFKIRGISENEEVWAVWDPKRQPFLWKVFSVFLARIHILIMRKGALEIGFKGMPESIELQREWYKAQLPLATWTPYKK